MGQVLAIKATPVIPGRDGTTVTGEIIKAKSGRDVPLRAGKGVILLNNETKAVAACPGRPVYKKGILSIIPVLVVPHDVDIEVGNIYFDGDVVIKGNVTENLKVSAGGDITILGNVYHGTISAEGNIRVYGNLIASKLSAGLNMLNCLAIIPKFKQLLGVVKKHMDILESSSPLEDQTVIKKELLKTVISEKCTLDNIIQDILNLMKLSYIEESEDIIRILSNTKLILTGINAKCLNEPEQIKILFKGINDYIKRTKQSCGRNSNIVFGYGQNSFIQASGDITITKKGCYQTNLIAKNSIVFKNPSGVIRGGQLIAGKYIKGGIIGTPFGISTYCKILDKDGKIDALTFSNAVLNTGGEIKIINSNKYSHRN